MITDAPSAVTAAAAESNSDSTVMVDDSVPSSVEKVPRSTGEASLTSTMTSTVAVATTEREGARGEAVWEGEGRSPCTKCGVLIEAGLMPEHLDFHYAQDLQNRYSREGDGARHSGNNSRTSAGNHLTSSGSSSGEKRKREEGAGRGSVAVGSGVGRRASTKASNVKPTRRIDSFFKPL